MGRGGLGRGSWRASDFRLHEAPGRAKLLPISTSTLPAALNLVSCPPKTCHHHLCRRPIKAFYMCTKSHQSCPTLCDPMDYSPPDSSVHGILQARILEWVCHFPLEGSSRPRDGTVPPTTAGRFFTTAPPAKPKTMCGCACMPSHIQLFATPKTISLGFLKQEY